MSPTQTVPDVIGQKLKRAEATKNDVHWHEYKQFGTYTTDPKQVTCQHCKKYLTEFAESRKEYEQRIRTT